MSTNSTAISAPRLPDELLCQIASEVAQLRTNPSDDQNRSMPYAEWVANVTAVNQLARAAGLFREELCRVWSSQWTLWRIDTTALLRVGLPETRREWTYVPDMQYSPALPKIDSDDQSFVLGSVPDRIFDLAPRTVENLVLTDDDWIIMMFFVKRLAWNGYVGFSHIPSRLWTPWTLFSRLNDRRDWTHFDATEFRECVRKFEGLPSEGHDPQDPGASLPYRVILFLHNWPCASVKHLTVILRNHSCLGFPLNVRETYAKMSHDFSSGLCLHLPDHGEMEAAADLVVNLFPRMERLTITRAPIADSVKRNWAPQPLDSEDSTLCDVRTLFGEPSTGDHSRQNWILEPLKFEHPAMCDVRTLYGEPSIEDYSGEYCTEPDRMLMPTKVGADFAGMLRVEEIARELANVDEVFLRLVHDRIAVRPSLDETSPQHSRRSGY